MLALLLLREAARERSPLMPYARLLEGADVRGMPMTWPPFDPRWAEGTPSLRRFGRASQMDALDAYAGGRFHVAARSLWLSVVACM